MSKLESAEQFADALDEWANGALRTDRAIELIRARDAAQFRAGALAALERLDTLDYILGAKHGGNATNRREALRRQIESGDWP